MGHMSATGFWMVPRKIGIIKFGLIYNFYAITDARNICSSGWHVPTQTQFNTLRSGQSYLAAPFRETGTLYWEAPNDQSTNSTKFNARAGGWRRNTDGAFIALLIKAIWWTSTDNGGGKAAVDWIDKQQTSASFSFGQTPYRAGYSIRLMKDSTLLSDGETGSYTGNDGRVYNTICIGTQEWTSENIAETKYANGDSITEVKDPSSWAALNTGALCAYNNDWDYV